MNPFEDFDRLFEDRVRRFFGPSTTFFWPSASPAMIESGPTTSTALSTQRTGPTTSTILPLLSTRLDMTESDDSYRVHVELPGVRKDDIRVSVDGDVLTVEAERKERTERQDDRYHYAERRFGKIRRQVPLPTNADKEKVEAKFEDGVLQLQFGKAPESEKRKTISIQ